MALQRQHQELNSKFKAPRCNHARGKPPGDAVQAEARQNKNATLIVHLAQLISINLRNRRLTWRSFSSLASSSAFFLSSSACRSFFFRSSSSCSCAMQCNAMYTSTMLYYTRRKGASPRRADACLGSAQARNDRGCSRQIAKSRP